MAVCQVDHIAINSYNMKDSLNFYCGLLGLKQGKSVDMGELILNYVDLPDGSAIELFEFKDPGFYQTLTTDENAVKHIALKVDEIEEMYATLVENQVPIDMELCELTPLGVKALLCKDPNGVVVELSQKLI